MQVGVFRRRAVREDCQSSRSPAGAPGAGARGDDGRGHMARLPEDREGGPVPAGGEVCPPRQQKRSSEPAPTRRAMRAPEVGFRQGEPVQGSPRKSGFTKEGESQGLGSEPRVSPRSTQDTAAGAAAPEQPEQPALLAG